MERHHMSAEAHRYAAEELSLEAEKQARAAITLRQANFQDSTAATAAALAAAGSLHLALSQVDPPAKPEPDEHFGAGHDGVIVTVRAPQGSTPEQIRAAIERVAVQASQRTSGTYRA